MSHPDEIPNNDSADEQQKMDNFKDSEDERVNSNPFDLNNMHKFMQAAVSGNINVLIDAIADGVVYPEIDGFPNPLSIACSEPPYYRMITLLCLNGGSIERDLTDEQLNDLPIRVACHLRGIQTNQDDYDKLLILTTLQIKSAELLTLYAVGDMSDEELFSEMSSLNDEKQTVMVQLNLKTQEEVDAFLQRCNRDVNSEESDDDGQ